MVTLIENFAQYKVNRDEQGALELAKIQYTEEYQKIIDATGGGWKTRSL